MEIAMTATKQSEELLAFFKALSDANRLKIIGLLAQGTYTVEELAALLDLRPSTVSHHLSRLSDVGLVSARAESYYNLYQLETRALETMAQRLLARETLPEMAADIDLDAYDRQVVKNFSLPDGRLRSIPAQRKKLKAILRYVVRDFEPGRQYTEKQVNEILGQYHEDTAGLRRDLIDYQMMAREVGGSAYWLTEAP
jgi:predicted transcriptional regulator